MASPDEFVFPRRMPPEEAQRLLAESYAELDEGKILRMTNKRLRSQGIDPPMDVQYVAEPAVAEYADGLGVSLGCDIMIYDEFPEMQRCIDAFEACLSDLLMGRLEKKVGKWMKRQPRP